MKFFSMVTFKKMVLILGILSMFILILLGVTVAIALIIGIAEVLKDL